MIHHYNLRSYMTLTKSHTLFIVKKAHACFPAKNDDGHECFREDVCGRVGEWVVAMGFGSQVREAFIGKSVFCHRAYCIH